MLKIFANLANIGFLIGLGFSVFILTFPIVFLVGLMGPLGAFVGVVCWIVGSCGLLMFYTAWRSYMRQTNVLL